ncbi:4-hydroxy-3-methylbut-2-enyl diphosphate reductase [Trebonia sp.]|uniref:4-hydroxy-3-methylbut-2-enyl diphosphate reductase n=1 Tax=Trebonia sp. TaxID=2767075 RepID=UPI002632EC6A|nr:4-hydroxy-3-methylbut-2-enyl diphosphate reductase [Trebonia sp.]
MTETIPQPRTAGAADTAEPAGATAGLVVLAPLRLEANAVRRGLRDPASRVQRTGMGATRAAKAVRESKPDSFGALIVMGTAAGVCPDLKPGDLVVAAEVTDASGTVSLPGAELLAAELRRAGLPARPGKLATVPSLVRSSQRAKLAAQGYLAADMESAVLVGAADGRPVAVIRAVSDVGVGPGIVSGGLAALRSLRLAAPVAERWAAACAQRTVLLAGPRSFCAGVERAIEIVERALDLRGAPVYVRKQIVHNTRVVADLEQRGAVFVDELDEVPDGATVVFSAHGVSPAVRDAASGRGLSVIDATCPLVSKVHAEARRFAREGYTVALIGHAGHEEVEGTLGEAPESTVLVQTVADVAALRPRDPDKVAYLMQTTLAVDEAADVAAALHERFPQTRAPGSDDICYATTNRQAAVHAVAQDADLVLVAGSKNSSNSVRLVERSQRAGTPAYLIDGAADIELSWLSGVSVVGLTAGASAPPAVVSEIISALSGLGAVTVAERVTTTESVQFGLPREVRG